MRAGDTFNHIIIIMEKKKTTTATYICYVMLSTADHNYFRLNPFPNKALAFTCLQYKSLENTLEKGEIAPNEQFLLFPQCFLSILGTFYHFHQILAPPYGSVLSVSDS